MFKKLSDLEQLIKKNKVVKTLALAVSQDPHSLDAVAKAYESGIIKPVLIGDQEQTESIIKEQGYNFKGARFVNEADPEKCVQIAVTFH